MKRRILAALVPCALACAESRQSIPPILQSAPPTIAGTTIAIDLEPNVGGYWSHNVLGPQLARALARRLEETLSRAGYITVRYTQEGLPPGSRMRPDLLARLTAELSGSTKDLQSVTRLEIVHDGKLVGRFEVKSPEELPSLKAELYPEYVAVTLANRLMVSPEILAVSPEPRRLLSRSALSAENSAGPVVALFDVSDASGQLDEPSQEQLSEYLSVRATQALGYRVLPRTSVRELLQAKKQESYRTCVEETCQIELGKSLAAEKMLATKLIRLGAACALTTTLFDLKTETAELATSIKTKCAKESLLQGVDDLVDALKKQRNARPS